MTFSWAIKSNGIWFMAHSIFMAMTTDFNDSLISVLDQRQYFSWPLKGFS